MDLEGTLREVIAHYNEFRSPEAHAELVSLEGGTFWVSFTGYFCRTCGVYDYFEDLQEKLRDRGVKTKIVEIQETPNGAAVTFQLLSQDFSSAQFLVSS